jgi:tetratricopeptide (TPR) repeat protein
MSRIGLIAGAMAVLAILGLLGGRKLGHPREAERPSGNGAPAAKGRPQEGVMPAAERERIVAFWGHYRRATAELQSGHWTEAARSYLRALELNPDHWDSLYYLGNSYMELGRYEEAEEAYRRLAASDREAARAYSALGALYSNPRAGGLFDLDRAAEQYRAAWRANGDESGSILRLGEVAVAAGENSKALEYLRAAGRTNFKSVNAFFLQGYLAWRRGQLQDARSLYVQGIELTKNQKPPKGVLGEGDTRRPGQQAHLRPGHRGLFDQFVGELWQDSDSSEARMTNRFRQVQRFIDRLPSKRNAP